MENVNEKKIKEYLDAIKNSKLGNKSLELYKNAYFLHLLMPYDDVKKDVLKVSSISDTETKKILRLVRKAYNEYDEPSSDPNKLYLACIDSIDKAKSSRRTIYLYHNAIFLHKLITQGIKTKEEVVSKLHSFGYFSKSKIEDAFLFADICVQKKKEAEGSLESEETKTKETETDRIDTNKSFELEETETASKNTKDEKFLAQEISLDFSKNEYLYNVKKVIKRTFLFENMILAALDSEIPENKKNEIKEEARVLINDLQFFQNL